MNYPDVRLLLMIVLGAGLAAALWYFWDDIRPPADEAVVVQPAPVAEEQPGLREPIHPILPLSSSGLIDGELVPLPPLDESDSYFLLALTDIFGAPGTEPMRNDS